MISSFLNKILLIIIMFAVLNGLLSLFLETTHIFLVSGVSFFLFVCYLLKKIIEKEKSSDKILKKIKTKKIKKDGFCTERVNIIF